MISNSNVEMLHITDMVSLGVFLGEKQDIKDCTVLLIDDEESMHDSCTQVLSRAGYTILTAFDGDRGMSLLREKRPDIVLLDLKLPGKSGINILKEIYATDPTIVTVVITGFATIESAVEAMKLHASDFLPKPFTPDELRLIVKRGLDKRELLVKTRQLADENRRIRENFVSIITHEMRSPLVAVEQYIEVLLSGISGPLDSKQSDMLRKSKRRILWLLSLVNEWLSMARIQDSVILYKLDLVSIQTMLDDAIDLVLVQAEKKHIEIENIIPENLPPLLGNYDLLIHLFMNLYSNAIKYNREHGKIITTVSDEGDSIFVKIADTGIGIAQESLPFIFDEFYRVREKTGAAGNSTQETGTGLGLAIVKKIVDVHRGYISVESQLDAGTNIKVHLPKKQNIADTICFDEKSDQKES